MTKYYGKTWIAKKFHLQTWFLYRFFCHLKSLWQCLFLSFGPNKNCHIKRQIFNICKCIFFCHDRWNHFRRIQVEQRTPIWISIGKEDGFTLFLFTIFRCIFHIILATNVDIFCLTELANKKDEGTQSKHQNARKNNILRINVTPLTIQERKLELKQHCHQFCIIPSTKLWTGVFSISLFGSWSLYTLVRNQGLEYYRVFIWLLHT